MSRITSIAARIRVALVDQNAERWPDSRIIMALNEAMHDLATNTRILKSFVEIGIRKNVPEYDLPEDLWDIRRVGYGGLRLQVRSTHWMDANNISMWILEKGTTPKAVIHDAGGVSQLRVYPIPSDEPIEVESSSSFGLVDSFAESTSTDFGLAEDLSSSTEINGIGVEVPLVSTDEEEFGIIGDVDSNVGNLQVWYTKVPSDYSIDADLSTLNEPELPRSYDNAIVHYCAGSLLRDDTTVSNREKASVHFSLYERELAKLKSNSAMHQSADPVGNDIPYNTGFNR